MAVKDYYRGPTTDITNDGVPAICTTENSTNTNTWAITNPGDTSWLATLENTDISGTFLVNWIKKTKTEIQTEIWNPDNGYIHPDAP